MTTASPLPTITVLLAGLGDLARSRLHGLLRRDPRFTVVGEPLTDVASVPRRLQLGLVEALTDPIAQAHRVHPDLIVLDPFSGGAVDLSTIDRPHAAAPNARLVILTATFDPHLVTAAMTGHIYGYFLKEFGTRGERLLDALALIAREAASVVDLKIAVHLASYPDSVIAPRPPVPEMLGLTRRERQVLLLALEGQTDEEIAHELGTARVTAETHVRNVMLKLGAKTRTHLGALATRAGLV